MPAGNCFSIRHHNAICVLQLESSDGTNRLTRACVLALTDFIARLAVHPPRALIITGNRCFFSAGAELQEVRALDAISAMAFARMGRQLMDAIDSFPATVVAAVHGYCLGGGLDLALACDLRIASRQATFGHRGAALGLITGWGGTQRLSRLVGKGRALQMFLAAEKVNAATAYDIGLIEQLAEDPVLEAITRLTPST